MIFIYVCDLAAKFRSFFTNNFNGVILSPIMRRELGPLLAKNLANPFSSIRLLLSRNSVTLKLFKSGVIGGYEYLHNLPVLLPPTPSPPFRLNCARQGGINLGCSVDAWDHE